MGWKSDGNQSFFFFDFLRGASHFLQEIQEIPWQTVFLLEPDTYPDTAGIFGWVVP